MTLEQAKEELIIRYKYLYENAYFILAPFMHKQTQEELEDFNKKYGFSDKEPSIFFNLNIFENIGIVSSFEEFLLSDKNMEGTSLYQMVERNKNDKDYLEKVNKGLTLLEEKNKVTDFFKKD